VGRVRRRLGGRGRRARGGGWEGVSIVLSHQSVLYSIESGSEGTMREAGSIVGSAIINAHGGR
jgi:hypothetical protein